MSFSRERTPEPERIGTRDFSEIIERLKRGAASLPTPTRREAILHRRAERCRRFVRWIAECGLPEDNWHPLWTRVPADIRGEVGSYCLNIRRHVRNREGAFVGSVPGAGKTSLLALIAAAARRNGIACVYIESGAFLWHEINRRRRNLRTDETMDLLPYDDYPLVLLDDVDDLWAGESEEAQWSDITKFLKHRHGRRLTTVIAGNKTFRKLCAAVSGKPLDWVPSPEDPAGRMVDRWADCLPYRLETSARSQRGTATEDTREK